MKYEDIKTGMKVKTSAGRVIIVEGKTRDGRNDQPTFHGMCIAEKSTAFGSVIGVSVWDYVDNITGVVE